MPIVPVEVLRKTVDLSIHHQHIWELGMSRIIGINHLDPVCKSVFRDPKLHFCPSQFGRIQCALLFKCFPVRVHQTSVVNLVLSILAALYDIFRTFTACQLGWNWKTDSLVDRPL